MSYFKRFLLLGSIGVSLLAGLMFTTHTTVSSTAFASGCTTVAEGYYKDGLGDYFPAWGNTCTVSEGNISNAVYGIQLDINESGIHDPFGNQCTVGKVDGDFGQGTFNGVECFQRYYVGPGSPLSIDGIVGPQTWAALSDIMFGSTTLNTGGWTYFEDGHLNKDFRMWGQSPFKSYVDAGGCWRQMDENSDSCE